MIITYVEDYYGPHYSATARASNGRAVVAEGWTRKQARSGCLQLLNKQTEQEKVRFETHLIHRPQHSADATPTAFAV